MGMKEHTTRKIYNIQSYFYDRLVGTMRRRQRDAISKMRLKEGDRLLDIGIGTGMSLATYPKYCKIVGIDISEGMMGRAHQRIKEDNLEHASLVLSDAMFMPFKDHSFDHILISHVITVVSDPTRLFEQIKRVAKPNARIVIINHFQSGYRPIAWLEKVLCPICVKLGWRSDLNLHELLEKTDIKVDFRYKVDNLDLWEIVFMRNAKPKLGRYDIAMQSVPKMATPAYNNKVGTVIPAVR